MTNVSAIAGPLAFFYLTIVHQNDIHSHFGLIRSSGYTCRNPQKRVCYGGFSRAVHVVKNEIMKDKYSKNLLIVNAGDFYKGNLYYSEFKWRLIADMVQHMPYTALALGDAEFTDGLDGLMPFLRAIGEKFVCTNIDFSGVSNITVKEELRRLCPRHRIIPYQGGARHVCLLGYTTPRATYLFSNHRIVFEEEEEALTREIKAVRKSRPDVKIFVAIGHSGYERDKQIAHRVPSLDVIVGGHSHTLLWPNLRNKMVAGVPDDPGDKNFAKDVYPTVVIQPSGRTVLIVQMYKNGKYLGVLNVTFNEDDEVVDYFASPRLLTTSVKMDKDTEQSLHKYREEMKRKQQQVIGSTRVELKGDYDSCKDRECNLGNLVTDAMLWHIRRHAVRGPRTLVAVINAGAMKMDILPGKFRTVDVTKSMPYPDTMNVVELRGKTIKKMLEHGLGDSKSGTRFLQISGMRVRYNTSRPYGQRVQSIRIMCASCVSPRFEPLNESATYSVAMFTYIALGNDGFDMIRDDRVSSQQRHDISLDIFIDYVKQFSPLHPYIDGRIEIISAPTVNNTAVSTRHGRGRWPVAATVAAAGTIAVMLVTL